MVLNYCTTMSLAEMINSESWLVNGYTKQVSLSYDRLYFDKKLKWGVNLSFAMGKNHEINYNTIGNKQVFLTDSNIYLRNFIHATAEVSLSAVLSKQDIGLALVIFRKV